MFPEITRDEVFRIESRRLWLRWPVMADAFDANTTAVKSHAATVEPGCRLPASACVAAWRVDAERGAALHLILEEKAVGRPAVGIIHLTHAQDGLLAVDYHLVPDRRGEGLMTEAIQSLVHTAFLLRLGPAITAMPAATDRAGRDVLERCGFTYIGSGMRPSPAGPGLAACDHFRLDRRTWLSLQGWGTRGLGSVVRSGSTSPEPGIPAQV